MLHNQDKSGQPGEIVNIEKNGPVYIQTGQGIVAVLEIKPEGKKIMSAADFVRGYRLETRRDFGLIYGKTCTKCEIRTFTFS